MCMMKTPKPKDPVMPPEYAAQRAPDGEVVRDTASRRVKDNMRSRARTILTSSSGVTEAAPTQMKTLLGQ